MDEPVGPGADEHAFDQFVGPAPRPDLGEVSIEPDARRAAAPAPLLGRDGGDVLHAALDAQTGARVSLVARSEEHTSELQSLMRISYAVFCLKKEKRPKMKE